MPGQVPKMNHNTVLVTGGAGFVGSNLAVSLKKKYSSMRVIALDNLKRRGSELNIKLLKRCGVEFVHGDIRNPEDLEFDTEIDLLLECSAEPSVLAGFGESPAYLINTNLTGTINCLELARKNKTDVIFLSTSRVYPYDALNSIRVDERVTRFAWSTEQQRDIPGWSLNGVDVGFSLEGPKSMYGATKLCSEIILQEYMKMYGIRAVINRFGVIAGPGQFGKVDQGVFTLWMLYHYFKKDLSYIGFGGEGKQVRDALHVDDVFTLVDIQLSSMDKFSGRTYNVGGGDFLNMSLQEATELAQDITGNNIQINPDPSDRPADVLIYITDNNKVMEECNWRPQKNKEVLFTDIYNWIKDNEKDIAEALI